jgi:hypothetical protein
MKLFELFNNDAQQGRVNIKKIAEAVKSGTGTTILAGTELLVLEQAEARELYSLYESSLDYGTQDKFVESLGLPLNESTETLEHILARFPKEVKDFKIGHELDEDLYLALFDYYQLHGEMPYGIAKARTGDPFDWVTSQLDAHLGGGMNVSMDADRPAESSMMQGNPGIFDSLHKAKAPSRNQWLDLGKDDRPEPGKRKSISTGEIEYKDGGQIHRSTKRYSGSEEEVKTKEVPGEEAEKRGRGRPRVRPLPAADAEKRGRGRPRKSPAPDATAPKRGRGRPRKVAEWIENLKVIAEGKK